MEFHLWLRHREQESEAYYQGLFNSKASQKSFIAGCAKVVVFLLFSTHLAFLYCPVRILSSLVFGARSEWTKWAFCLESLGSFLLLKIPDSGTALPSCVTTEYSLSFPDQFQALVKGPLLSVDDLGLLLFLILSHYSSLFFHGCSSRRSSSL